MSDLWKQFFVGVDDSTHILRVVVRMFVSIVLGGIIGWERQHERKSAGLRTHMLVALGSTLFVIVPLEGGMSLTDASRVVQGVAAGIGFLGAGCILKLSEEHRIEGLTTAATIWFTAAVGVAIGLGWIWPALLGITLAWIVLYGVHQVEFWLRGKMPPDPTLREQKPVKLSRDDE
jgi:putative Mg2+ transporter-C (MgtC) family protein